MWHSILRPSFLRPALTLAGCTALDACQSRQKTPLAFTLHLDSHTSPGKRLLQCGPKVDSFVCSGCDERLPRNSFAVRQLHQVVKTCRHCLSTRHQPAHTLCCTQCHEQLSPDAFSERRRRRTDRICSSCAQLNEQPQQPAHTLPCRRCHEQLPPDASAPRNRRRTNRICTSCTQEAASFFTCVLCGETSPMEDLAVRRQSRSQKVCKGCCQVLGVHQVPQRASTLDP